MKIVYKKNKNELIGEVSFESKDILYYHNIKDEIQKNLKEFDNIIELINNCLEFLKNKKNYLSLPQKDYDIVKEKYRNEIFSKIKKCVFKTNAITLVDFQNKTRNQLNEEKEKFLMENIQSVLNLFLESSKKEIQNIDKVKEYIGQYKILVTEKKFSVNKIISELQKYSNHKFSIEIKEPLNLLSFSLDFYTNYEKQFSYNIIEQKIRENILSEYNILATKLSINYHQEKDYVIYQLHDAELYIRNLKRESDIFGIISQSLIFKNYLKKKNLFLSKVNVKNNKKVENFSFIYDVKNYNSSTKLSENLYFYVTEQKSAINFKSFQNKYKLMYIENNSSKANKLVDSFLKSYNYNKNNYFNRLDIDSYYTVINIDNNLNVVKVFELEFRDLSIGRDFISEYSKKSDKKKINILES